MEAPKIKAIIGNELSGEELEILMNEEFDFLVKNPLPIHYYDHKIEKAVDAEIERAYREVPAGSVVRYLKGVDAYRLYIINK
jgi:hypothetical protein